MEVAESAGINVLLIAGFVADASLLAAPVAGKLQCAVWDQPSVHGVRAVSLLPVTDPTTGHSTAEMGGARILIEPARTERTETLVIVATLSPEGLAGRY